jgi:hypothetical protein
VAEVLKYAIKFGVHMFGQCTITHTSNGYEIWEWNKFGWTTKTDQAQAIQ